MIVLQYTYTDLNASYYLKYFLGNIFFSKRNLSSIIFLE